MEQVPLAPGNGGTLLSGGFRAAVCPIGFRLKKGGGENPKREILLIRAEKRGRKIFCRSVGGFQGKSGEEIAVSGCEQLLQYLEGYQRLGYEIELTGFIE